jgi:hypothetical protein
MGMRRAQHHAVRLALQVDVVLKAALAAQEAPVLKAPHRLPDPELAHRLPHCHPGVRRDPLPRRAPTRRIARSIMPDWITGATGNVDPDCAGMTELSLRGAQRRSNLDPTAHSWHEIAALRSQ